MQRLFIAFGPLLQGSPCKMYAYIGSWVYVEFARLVFNMRDFFHL